MQIITSNNELYINYYNMLNAFSGGTTLVFYHSRRMTVARFTVFMSHRFIA